MTPITFTAAAALTAAQLNGTRDNLTFLKGALDLITNSTTADTGTTTYLNINRPTASSAALTSAVTADTFSRHQVDADGKHSWGSGTAAVDTNLYRSSANILRTDDSFSINGMWDFTSTGYLTAQEIANPGNGPANTGIIYCRDNGAGKSQIVAVFSTGAVQIIATEP